MDFSNSSLLTRVNFSMSSSLRSLKVCDSLMSAVMNAYMTRCVKYKAFTGTKDRKYEHRLQGNTPDETASAT